jgi:hypothetical protein
MTRKWIDVARQARTELQQSGKPGSMRELAAIAARHGLGRASLSNYLTALDFVEATLQQELSLGERLGALPVASILALQRWNEFDPAKMREFALQVPAPSARTAIAAERSARAAYNNAAGAGTSAPVGAAEALLARLGTSTVVPEVSGREQPGPVLSAHFARLGLPGGFSWRNLAFRREDLRYATQYGVSFVGSIPPEAMYREKELSAFAEYARRRPQFTSKNGDGLDVVALINVPRYGALEFYRREARALWARSALLTTLYPLVVQLFETETACEETIAGLPEVPAARLGTPVVEVSADLRWPGISPDQTRPAPAGLLRYAMADAGAILLTTAERFAQDWLL